MIRCGAIVVFATGFIAVADVRTSAWGATGPAAMGSLDGPITQGIVDDAPGVRPTNSMARERLPSGNPLWAVPLRSLTVTRERPIFSPSRRPAPPAVVAAPYVPASPLPKSAEPDHLPLSLVGTVVGDAQSIGIFFDPATKSVVRLKTGQAYLGWVLRSVRAREATFDKDVQSTTLVLPPPGAEQAALPAFANPAGLPAGGAWIDGDGQSVSPPAGKISQPAAAPLPAATRPGESWTDGDGQIVSPPQR